jgi:diguanylate cyclase (GGDEF)-like protein/PAS domain S-box-containing protein
VSEKNLVRILTVFDTSEEAETLVNLLRNSGHIVRDIRVEDDEDMETALEENPIDIIIAKHTLPLFSAKQAQEILIRTGRDIPLVVITAPGKEASAMDALNSGARDVVASDQGERFKHIIARELGDLHERRAHRRNEKLLRETEKRARDLIDSSRDAIAYVHDGMHIYANKAYLKMFGYDDLEDIEGMPILDMVSSEDHANLKEFLRSYAKGQAKEDHIDVHGQNVDGDNFDITMEFSNASMEGESCSQIIIRDQADSKELEKQLTALSKQDLLTGLYNRNYFIEQVDRYISIAVEGKSKGGILYMTLDNYEELKDKIGISGIDLLITDIAATLKEKIGDKGLLARFEGPVFTFLLQDVDQKQLEKAAEAICKLIADHISDINGRSVNTTASIGITAINDTTNNALECIERAEKGSHSAKRTGGNQYFAFNPAIEELEEKEEMVVWAQRIKSALKNNHFKLLFQPIVSLHGDTGAHYEVLLRMVDEESGDEISPPSFMPAAEATSLTNFIDRWVIANTLMVLADRLKQNMPTRMFLKLSVGSLADSEFLPWISERLKSMRIDTTNLVFEISESTALNHLKQAQVVIEGLRQLNCRVVLENFGMEQNTLQALKHFEVDYIKFHPELMKGLIQNTENQEKIKNISHEVSEKNIQTIAAYVEDANSLAILWQSSINFIQGHFLQQPDVDMNYDFTEGF